MNDYMIGDLEVGMMESFSRTVDLAMLDAFRELSGDTNPLHCDTGYALECGYADRVAYGMLTASFYSTLVGVYLPGRRCLLNSIDIQFKKPVFPGDVLTVVGEVVMVHEGLGVLKVKAKMVNQSGDKVSTATIQVSVRSDE